MSFMLYYSKVNINSHIFNIYEDKKLLEKILKSLFINIREGASFIQEDVWTVDDKEYFYDAVYKFNFIEKSDDYTIVGTLIKTSDLFINKVDEETGELIRFPVKNSEVIEFYFDVLKEKVVFYTTNRFGYNQFNRAFKELINECMSNNDEKFNFELSLIKKGLSVENIKEELKALGRLVSLKIEIIPPNPDDDLLDEIQKNYEEFLHDIKEGNVTHKSTIFTSTAMRGLNLDSKIINNELNELKNIHSTLDSKKAIKYGYAAIEAMNSNGKTFTTNENKPIKTKIDEKPSSIKDFAELCKNKLASILSS